MRERERGGGGPVATIVCSLPHATITHVAPSTMPGRNSKQVGHGSRGGGEGQHGTRQQLPVDAVQKAQLRSPVRGRAGGSSGGGQGGCARTSNLGGLGYFVGVSEAKPTLGPIAKRQQLTLLQTARCDIGGRWDGEYQSAIPCDNVGGSAPELCGMLGVTSRHSEANVQGTRSKQDKHNPRW